MSKVLVTGATGFVGREVCRHLIQKGHTVLGTTRDQKLSFGPENIPLYHLPEFNSGMDWLPAVSGVDAVVHLAARVHQVIDQSEDPLSEYRRVNLDGTKTLAIAAAKAGVKRLVFLSSIKVNGELTQGGPFSEDDHPAPVDAYGVSKWAAEKALIKVASAQGMAAVILRSPLVYGPHVGGNFAVLARAVIKKRPMPLCAIANRRSLVYVGNLASAIFSCLDHPDAPGETFLVSDGEDVSTGELVSRMAKATSIRNWLFYCPVWLLRVAGTLAGRQQMIDRITGSLEVNSDKIRHVLSWSPPYSLDEGLQATMNFFNKTSHR